MKIYKSQNMLASSSGSTLLTLTIVWMHSLTLVKCQDAELKTYYEHLYDTYNTDKDKIKSDCNIADTPGGHIDALEHSNWGTLTSLEYLTEKKKNLALGEAEQDFAKLRLFLARIGYLKVPGSVVFINKQAETLRLYGCGDGAIWKMQGEKGVDPTFREVGGELKTHAPNSADYIHKITCFTPKGKDSCSHTFYLITRMLPELPSGFQVREKDSMKEDDWRFTCAVPLCNVKQCEVTGQPLNRRAYPPYTIKWSVKSRAKNEEAKRGKKQSKLELTEAKNDDNKANKIQVKDGQQLRKNQEADGTLKDGYVDATEEQWINAFGDKVDKPSNNTFNFNSRLLLLGADYDLHNGPYECIIQDGNGVVSTPSVIKEGYRDWVDFKGKANIHVMPSYALWLYFAIGIVAIVLVALIILICPKKMEYDDGTPYTKEELEMPHAAKDAQNPSTKGSKKDMKEKTS